MITNKHFSLKLHMIPSLGDQTALWSVQLQAVPLSITVFHVHRFAIVLCVPSCQPWKPQSWLTYKNGVQERYLKQEQRTARPKCRGQALGKNGCCEWLSKAFSTVLVTLGASCLPGVPWPMGIKAMESLNGGLLITEGD